MSSSFDRFLAQIVSPGLRQVAEHWHEARGDRLMPAWSAIDPSKIVRILPDIWAYSFDQTTGTFRAKLAGNNIVSRYAGHHAGKSIDELFSSPERDVIRTRFMRIATGPCFIRDYGPIYTAAGRYGEGERIAMPLATDGLNVDAILGATFYRCEVAAAPVEDPISHLLDEANFYPL